MDVFIEKIVVRKRTAVDVLIVIGLIILSIFLIFFVLPFIPLINSIWFFASAVVIFFAYNLAKSRYIEYEYSVTNGDLDIDTIIARRKRKRIFSGHCRDFEIVAKLKSSRYNNSIENIPKKINAASSLDSPDVYFIVTEYNGERTVIYFEPDQRMLDSFKTFIPRKVFED